MFPKKTYKKRKPTLAQRGKFSNNTVRAIMIRDNESCVLCGGEAEEIHHVKYKSSQGRGVASNGVSICRTCHDKAHSESEVRKELENMMIETFGSNYYKDEYDV